MRRPVPTICFDTSVCINAAKEVYPGGWRAVWRRVTKCFDYAIIPLVLIELLLGIARGGDAHFEQNRRALGVLYPTHKKRILRTPGVFAVETVLGRRPAGNFQQPYHVEAIARAVMRAGRLAELSPAVNFDLLRAQMDRGQRDHIGALEKLRSGKLSVPSAEQWAAGWIDSLGFEANKNECELVADALDAARRYDFFLWHEAMQGTYKFENHLSDWIDSQLLYYLADPDIHILSDDTVLLKRIAGSRQADRVFSCAEFMSCADPARPR